MMKKERKECGKRLTLVLVFFYKIHPVVLCSLYYPRLYIIYVFPVIISDKIVDCMTSIICNYDFILSKNFLSVNFVTQK